MGDAVGGLLGDKPAKSKNRALPNMSPEQLALLKQIMGEFSGELGPTTDITQYNGQFAAPLSNLQNLSLSAIENLSQEMGSSAAYQQGNEAITNMLKTGGQQNITDTFTNSILNPALKTFKEQTIPGVIGAFGGTGAYGSDRMRAQNTALGDLEQNVLSAGSRLAYDSGNAANQNILQALGLLPNQLGVPLNAAVTALNAGNVQQTTGQRAIDNQLAYINSQNVAKSAKLNAMIAALGLKPTENVTTVTPANNSGSQLAGAAMGAAAVAGFF